MNISRWQRATLAVASLLLVAGCGDDVRPRLSTSVSASIDNSVRGNVAVSVGDRAFLLYVPRSHDPARPVPLIVALHGYGSNANEMDEYLRLREQSEQRGFLLALPDGTTDRSGKPFWNATDFCCNFDGSVVDDSLYLSKIINLVKSSHEVNAVFLIGHSNGGFMAHRMACEHADQVTAIATLAGVLWKDSARCQPSRPVSVLHIHGTSDATIGFGGTARYPSAEETVARWRSMDGCTDAADTAPPALDLDAAVAGAETSVTSYADGCKSGATVRLWRMTGSGHVPSLTDAFTPAVLSFLYSAAGLS